MLTETWFAMIPSIGMEKGEIMEGHAPLDLNVVAFPAKNFRRFCMLKLQPLLLQNLSMN